MSFLGLLERKLINESASVENVTKAMDNHSKVIINYHSEGKDEHTGSRVIEPVAYGLTKTGNPVVRAYQPYGDSTTKAPGWKFFRLDRISYWEETSAKFDNIPDYDESELNKDGDKTMSTVIKAYNSTESPDATNGINIGPKTKEKVYAQTDMEDQLSTGRRNLERMKSGIKIDLDNNRKANSGFNIISNNTQNQETSGPRFPGQSNTNTPDTNGSVENGDISQEELDKAREQVYGGNNKITDDMWDELARFSDYQHNYEDDFENGENPFNNRQSAKDARNISDRDRRWEKSSDTRFLNRKGSGNRELYNMGHEDDEDEEL